MPASRQSQTVREARDAGPEALAALAMSAGAAAVLGGLLMGIGARLALGCNIGSFFSALPAFSLHGWSFMVFIFLGAAVGSSMLKKWFM